MKVNLRALLEAEEFVGDDLICPILSQYRVVSPKMGKGPQLESLSFVCAGIKCGHHNRCFNIDPGEK